MFRFPSLAASVALGAMLLTLAVTAYPLFISATASQLLRADISEPTVTRYSAGMSYSRSNVLFQADGIRQPRLTDELGSAFKEQVSRSSLLDDPIEYVLGPVASVGTESHPVPVSGPISGRLVYASKALDHVDALAGRDGLGVWIPRWIAHIVGAGPGDDIVLRIGPHEVSVPIDGVYRSLFSQPRRGYWLRWSAQIYEDPLCKGCPPPPQPIIVDRGQLQRLSEALGQRSGTFGWVAPLMTGPLSWDQANELERFVGSLVARMGDRDEYLGRLFECCTTYYSAPCCGFASETLTVSEISIVNTLVRERVEMLEGPGRLLQGAGILVAILVIAAAGSFGIVTRRVESALMLSRGVGPVRIGVKSLLEALIPCLMGSILGLSAAALLLGVFGPDGSVARSARSTAFIGGGIALFLSLLLLAVVSAISYLRQSGVRRTMPKLLSRAPWDLAMAIVALVVLIRLRSHSDLRSTSSDIDPAKSLMLLIFSTLFIVGLAATTARLLRSVFAAIRGRSTRFPTAPYLAIRRLAGAAKLTLLLVAASTLCLGIFVEAQTMVTSLRATVDAKAKIYIGSDVQGRVDYITPLPQAFPFPLTRVTRIVDAGGLANGRAFDLLAIDAESFVSAAYWDEGFADSSLEDIVGRLVRSSDGSSIPLVAVRGDSVPDTSSIDLQQLQVPVSVVARTSAFPGMTSLRPMLVVDEGTLLEFFAGAPNPLSGSHASTEFWVRGDPGVASAALSRIRYKPDLVLTTDEVKDIPSFIAVIDTFLVLGGLGIVAALLMLSGLLMYMQARQRSQVVSYGLSLRMGMKHETHRGALALEIGAMLVASYAVGASLGVAVVLLALPSVDPLPMIPPAPLFLVPGSLMLLAFVCVLGLSWCGAWLTNRHARKFDLGEVMRLAE